SLLSPLPSARALSTGVLLSHPSPDHHALRSFPTRRSSDLRRQAFSDDEHSEHGGHRRFDQGDGGGGAGRQAHQAEPEQQVSQERSEEHTSELQSRFDLVCRLLLEKKNSRADTRARTEPERT